MNEALAKKLRLPEAGARSLVLNAPEGYLGELGLGPDHAVYDGKLAGSYDFVQMFFRSIGEVENRAGAALDAVKPDGLLWLCYPKGGAKAGTDLTRDKGWETVKAAGFEGIALVSVDEVWSRRGAGSGAAPAKKPAQPVEAPEDLTAALRDHPQTAAFFDGLAPSHRKAYIEWISEAKREETRQSRIVKTVEKLEQGLKRPSDKA